MDLWALDIYRNVVGVGAGIEAVGLLAVSANPQARWRRALVSAGIGAIALLDAHTWSQAGILKPEPMTVLWWIDCTGLVAALWTLFALGIKGSPDAVRATDGAIAYIVCCLLYWLLITRADGHWASVKQALSIHDEIRLLYVVAFVVCVVVLGLVRRVTKGKNPQPWLPLLLSVWAYAVGYYVMVTYPFLSWR